MGMPRLSCRTGADSLRDMFYGILQLRVQSSTNLLLEAFHWLRSHHPYWSVPVHPAAPMLISPQAQPGWAHSRPLAGLDHAALWSVSLLQGPAGRAGPHLAGDL
jgi:hypothetical protein